MLLLWRTCLRNRTTLDGSRFTTTKCDPIHGLQNNIKPYLMKAVSKKPSRHLHFAETAPFFLFRLQCLREQRFGKTILR
jgi:hypothetical protein